MPKPATVQATRAIHTGTAGQRRPAIPARPARTRARPMATRSRGGPALNGPSLHPGAGRPGDGRDGQGHAGEVVEVWRIEVSVERYVGVAGEERECQQTPDQHRGRQAGPGPERARPGSGGARRGRPAPPDADQQRGTRRAGPPSDPASSSPAPHATSSADGRAIGAASPARGPGHLRHRGHGHRAADRDQGSSPRNTHRQPIWLATWAATAGPTRPGITHAVDRVANIRGRSRSG